jgi:hypothetical protein
LREERKVFQVVEKERGASSKEFRIRETIFIEKEGREEGFQGV